MHFVSATPAYGRVYTNTKQVREAWEAGKDFILHDITSKWDGKPFNKDDVIDLDWAIQIHYGKHRNKSMIIKTGKEG